MPGELRVGVAGHEQHADGRVSIADLLGELDPTATGHHNVGEEEIRSAPRVDQLQRFLGRARRGDLTPVDLENTPYDPTHGGVVLHDQDMAAQWGRGGDRLLELALREVSATQVKAVELPRGDTDVQRDTAYSGRTTVLHTVRVHGDQTYLVKAARARGTGDIGLQVDDVTDAENPKTVGTVPLDSSVYGLYEVNDWVVLVMFHPRDGGTLQIEVIDVSAPTAPKSAGRASVSGEPRSDAVLIGSKLMMLEESWDIMSRGVRTLKVSRNGKPTLSTDGALTTVEAHDTRHLVIPKHVTSETTELHVFDSSSNRGIVTVEGPLEAADVRGDVLRVAFETPHADPAAREKMIRTFDIGDLASIRAIDSSTVCCPEEPASFVHGGAQYGATTAVRIVPDGKIGAPQPYTASLSRFGEPVIRNRPRLLVWDVGADFANPPH